MARHISHRDERRGVERPLPWHIRRRLLIANLWYFIRYPFRVRSVSRRFLSYLRMFGDVMRGEVITVYATVSARHIRTDGVIHNYGVVSRKKVTQAFVKRLAAQMAANFAGADNWKYHDSGTSSAAESNADTGLGAPAGPARVVGSQTDTSSGTVGRYRSVGTITYAATQTIVEHGLFNASSGGVLLDRSTFAGIAVISGDSIEFTYELTINPEA